MLIAIDGPAGAGKSTVARALARELRFTYLDSGAMYRCVALAALRRGGGVLPERPGALGEVARSVAIDFADTDRRAAGREAAGETAAMPRVLLDTRDVSQQIRAPEVSAAASVVAADPAVREALVAKQRALIARGDWVAEGRDIGTVVAPDAALKIFLTADPRERARRRAAELGADVELVLAEQTMRDQRDSTRALSPLQAAPDAVMLDTSGLDVGDVVARIAGLAREL
ncbi:MAG TPA: (d)CMP kinase [Solirubrobacteraceae bacterium]|nr:(d)CMP kinase [Solirubrobacteraceae bacterium]